MSQLWSQNNTKVLIISRQQRIINPISADQPTKCARKTCLDDTSTAFGSDCHTHLFLNRCFLFYSHGKVPAHNACDLAGIKWMPFPHLIPRYCMHNAHSNRLQMELLTAMVGFRESNKSATANHGTSQHIIHTLCKRTKSHS